MWIWRTFPAFISAEDWPVAYLDMMFGIVKCLLTGWLLGSLPVAFCEGECTEGGCAAGGRVLLQHKMETVKEDVSLEERSGCRQVSKSTHSFYDVL